MPHSLILNLVPQTQIPAHYLTGRHLHALFLTLVQSVDPELSDRLHQNKALKGFSLSPLQLEKTRSRSPLQWQHKRNIDAGIPCWWRIGLLDDSLFGHLTPLWLQINPEQPWHLGPANLYITHILGTPQSTQPWANACPYAQLYDQASDAERNFKLEFATPTAFRQGKRDNALPTPQIVFQSLLRRWNQYSGIPFEDLPIDAIFPSQFAIETQCVEDSRSKFIGCVGTVRYRLFGDATPTQIKQLNAIADFALYCGVGRKTPMGMGMVRRVQSSGF
ncbi:MAG: CRISPR-associated endoribonuclease Cas6 [Cyanobacteriota bacterium]|nr:CRISPR-associated endoribonuclease Cas6 [Cyanobacteriota bacterium]